MEDFFQNRRLEYFFQLDQAPGAKAPPRTRWSKGMRTVRLPPSSNRP
jgi:hypothetical protein